MRSVNFSTDDAIRCFYALLVLSPKPLFLLLLRQASSKILGLLNRPRWLGFFRFFPLSSRCHGFFFICLTDLFFFLFLFGVTEETEVEVFKFDMGFTVFDKVCGGSVVKEILLACIGGVLFVWKE